MRIGIAPLDDFFRQAVGRKKNAKRDISGKLRNRRIRRIGDGADEAVRFRPATDLRSRRRQPGRPGSWIPDTGKTLGGRGGILRIKRQQNDAIRVPFRDVSSDGVGERMPVAHRDEDAIFVAERSLKRNRLLFGFRQDRRPAANFRVNFLCHGRTPPGYQPRQKPSDRRRHTQDHGIRKQVLQKRANGLGAIRSAEIVDNDGGPAHPRTAFIRRSTCSVGVSGRIPCPRLKICGPPDRASTISRARRSSSFPPASNKMGSKFP